MAEQIKMNLVISALNKFSAPFRELQTQIDKVKDKFSALGGAKIAKGFGNLSNKLSHVKNTIGALGSRVSALGSVFGKLGLAGSLAGGGIFALTKGVADAGREISKLSKIAGVSRDTMQELSYAAKMNGLETEELALQMATLGEWMVEANTGNEDIQKTFKAMGISVTDASGKLKKSDQVLMEMSDTFAQMEDGPAKAAIAMQFFGDAGLQMIPMLSKGSKNIKNLGLEAHKLGLVMSDKSVNASKSFSSSLVRLMEIIKGIGTTLGTTLMPHLQALIATFQEWIGTNRELINQKIKEWVQAFGKKIPAIIAGIKSFFGGIATLCSWVGKLTDFLGGAQNVFVILGALMAGPLLLAIGGAISAFLALGAAMFANPIGLIILGIGLAIGAFILFKDEIFGFAKFFMKIWDKICGFFGEQLAFIVDGIKAVGGWFSGLFGDEEKEITVNVKQKSSFEDLEDFAPNKNAQTQNPFANEAGGTGTKNLFGAPLMNKNNSIPKASQTASTQTKIERSEIKLILPEGVRAVGAENANGVTVDTDYLGMQNAWG